MTRCRGPRPSYARGAGATRTGDRENSAAPVPALPARRLLHRCELRAGIGGFCGKLLERSVRRLSGLSRRGSLLRRQLWRCRWTFQVHGIARGHRSIWVLDCCRTRPHDGLAAGSISRVGSDRVRARVFIPALEYRTRVHGQGWRFDRLLIQFRRAS